MISICENKSVIFKGDFHPAELYKGDRKISGYAKEEFEGEGSVILSGCYNDKVYTPLLYGKNLLDVKKQYGEYANESGGITLHTGELTNFAIRVQKNLTGVFKEKTQYTFSFKYNISSATTTVITPQFWYTDGTRSYFNIGLADSSGNNVYIGEGEFSYTSSAGKTVSHFNFSYGTNSKPFEGELYDMQIEEGISATEYEAPLTEAIVKVRGKNILDMLKLAITEGYYLDSSGQSSANSLNGRLLRMSIINVEPNTTYTISSNVAFYSIWRFAGSTSISKLAADKRNKISFTTPENCNRLGVSFDLSITGQTGEGVSAVKWVMLEKGNGDGVYEPYEEPQTVLLENGEFQADIPTFRGTTVIEIDSDTYATIKGKYKRMEV